MLVAEYQETRKAERRAHALQVAAQGEKMQAATALEFPAWLLRIVITIHCAPRVIKIAKLYSEIVQPDNSLLAGCISAIWLSRIMVCTIFAKAHEFGPIKARNYYDDIVSRASGRDAIKIADTLIEHGAAVGGQIAAAKLSTTKPKRWH